MKRRGSQYIGQCPICGDDDHLYIKETNASSGGANKVLLYCQKCNAPFEDIIKALGMDKPPLPKITPPLAAKKKQKASQTVIEDYDHVYRNPDGSVAYYKNRVKYDDGKKKFTFRHIDSNGETVYKKPDNCNCLYNLDLMESASHEETLSFDFSSLHVYYILSLLRYHDDQLSMDHTTVVIDCIL